MKCAEPMTNTGGSEITHIVISKVLCYVHFYMQSCTPNNVKAVVVSSFTEDEVSAAKRLLWTVPGNDKLGDYCERKKSNNRSVIEANVHDIIEALQCLDVARATLLFTVSDLRDLPSFSPEEINSVALLKRIEMLEKKCCDLENTSSQHQIQLCTLSNTVTKQGQSIETAENTIETHSTLIDTLQKDKGQEKSASPAEVDGHLVSSGSGDESSSPEDADDEDDDPPPPSTSGQRGAVGPDAAGSEGTAAKTSSNTDKAIKSVLLKEQHSKCENSGQRQFTNPASKKLHKPSYSSVAKARALTPAAITSFGNSSSGKARKTLTSANSGSNPRVDRDGFTTPRNRWKTSTVKVYIGNVNRRHSVDDVFDFLQAKKVRVSGLYQRSHFTAAKKSFVCLLSRKDLNNLKRNNDCQEFEIREYTDTAPSFRK